MKRLRILVVGSINMDLVLQVGRMPGPGENVLGQTYSYIPGGKGANQAVAAARLGADVTFVARVGQDGHGERLRQGLEAEGISTRHVSRDAEQPTGLAPIFVDGSGQNRIIVCPGANMTLAPQHAQQALAEGYDAVMLQLEVPDAVVAASFAAARAKGIPVVLDAGPARPFDLKLVEGIDILSPNQQEATALCGMPCDTPAQAAAAARRLVELSAAKAVVIKMGAAGAFVLADGVCELVPAYKVDAVDPTAAGDSFTAGLVIEWLRCRDLRKAASYGNAAGALAATKLGAQTSLPRADEVKAFLAARG